LKKNAPNLKKKYPQLKLFFQIPLTRLPHCPQFEKNAPNLKKNAPNFFLNYHFKKICPQLKNLAPFHSNLSIPNGIEKGIILTPEYDTY